MSNIVTMNALRTRGSAISFLLEDPSELRMIAALSNMFNQQLARNPVGAMPGGGRLYGTVVTTKGETRQAYVTPAGITPDSGGRVYSLAGSEKCRYTYDSSITFLVDDYRTNERRALTWHDVKVAEDTPDVKLSGFVILNVGEVVQEKPEPVEPFNVSIDPITKLQQSGVSGAHGNRSVNFKGPMPPMKEHKSS